MYHQLYRYNKCPTTYETNPTLHPVKARYESVHVDVCIRQSVLDKYVVEYHTCVYNVNYMCIYMCIYTYIYIYIYISGNIRGQNTCAPAGALSQDRGIPF